MLLAELIEAGFDRLGNQTSGRIVIAELIDETILAGLRGPINAAEGTIDLSERRHSLGHNDRNIVVARRFPDDTGECFLLRPNFDVIVALSKGAAAVVLSGVLKSVGSVVEGPRRSCPPTFINNPIPTNATIQPHLAQQADDCGLVFGLGLLDRSARDQLLEHLPDGLGMIGPEDRRDRIPDSLNLGLGPAITLYRACLIRCGGHAGALALAKAAASVACTMSSPVIFLVSISPDLSIAAGKPTHTAAE